MSHDALRTLIQTQPVWHNSRTANLPVTVRTVYTVLGRRQQRWSTVLATCDDIHMARDVMARASNSGRYDRVVMAKANSLNHAPATQWQTIECAVPTPIVPPSQFQQLVDQLQHDAANTRPRAFYLVGSIESCNSFLWLAGVLALINRNVPSLYAVAFFALCEAVLLADTRPMTTRKAGIINRLRQWGYAIFIGGLLWPLIDGFLQSQ